MALLSNFACHPISLAKKGKPTSRLISGDFPTLATDRLRESKGYEGGYGYPGPFKRDMADHFYKFVEANKSWPGLLGRFLLRSDRRAQADKCPPRRSCHSR